ncbi:MAG: hypothetical protein K8R88_05510 [Armatimonadetes bacterium]|nr:hypothetical protein [Armatimonadota bacterium]
MKFCRQFSVFVASVLAASAFCTDAIHTTPDLSTRKLQGEKKKSLGFGLGLSVSAFFPTSSKIKSAFQSSTISFGLSPTNIYFKDGMHTDFDLTVLTDSRSGSRYTVVLPSFGLLKSFGGSQQRSGVKPFVAARLGPAYYDYSILQGVNRTSERGWGLNANTEFGFFMNEKLRLSARYDWISASKGFRFDGLSLGATWQFVKF